MISDLDRPFLASRKASWQTCCEKRPAISAHVHYSRAGATLLGRSPVILAPVGNPDVGTARRKRPHVCPRSSFVSSHRVVLNRCRAQNPLALNLESPYTGAGRREAKLHSGHRRPAVARKSRGQDDHSINGGKPAVRWIASLILVAVGAVVAAGDPPAGPSGDGRVPGPVEFNRDIRPILSDKCYQCHGPDACQAQSRPAAGSGVVGQGRPRRPARRSCPGDLEASELYRRITSEDASERMPPVKSGKTLSADPDRSNRPLDRRGGEVAAALGVHPAESTADSPLSVCQDWARNPIDAFILARLEREGLAPSPEAERGILIRRVTLDLTGLPPTRAEIDCVRERRQPRRLREGRRPAAGFAPSRRADGEPLAGRGPLRRHQRLSDRRPAHHVAVARLGDRRLQPQHAVRPVHDRAARRRPAAARQRSTRRSPPASTATIAATARGASSPRSTPSSTSSIASRRRPRSGWA